MELPDILPQKTEFLSATQTAEEKFRREQGFKAAVKEFNAELQAAMNICIEAQKNLNRPDFNAEEYKARLASLQIAPVLALVPSTNLSFLLEKARNRQFFASIEKFCREYFLDSESNV